MVELWKAINNKAMKFLSGFAIYLPLHVKLHTSRFFTNIAKLNGRGRILCGKIQHVLHNADTHMIYKCHRICAQNCTKNGTVYMVGTLELNNNSFLHTNLKINCSENNEYDTFLKFNKRDVRCGPA